MKADKNKYSYSTACHTDLAVELKENAEQQAELEGVNVTTRKHRYHGIVQTEIEILDERGETVFGRPTGHYITLEATRIRKEAVQHKLADIICEEIDRLGNHAQNILIAGLGNHSVTPDAIGPKVVEQLAVTRHLFMEQGSDREMQMCMASAIAPGVMGQTGMESLEILQAMVHQIHPDLVIVIDALAARSSKRLNRTIQICDTGISPGSGVGNNRQEINEAGLGVKVLAIGIPTVIAVPTIIMDAMQTMLYYMGKEETGKQVREFSNEEQYALAAELVEPYFTDMFVTPKNIDEEVERMSSCLALGINQYITK